ncbi:hypothetical protein [uncultured Sphaerochaeta sp.]|uniref:hypothetical protein n=1 Tax=uncultured Sphaerochaeta sp. TaxID=886478 RepID=UPI002A0A83FD|nr:hypothetical protein [uncultured Sphaerochaeta sp.]
MNCNPRHGAGNSILLLPLQTILWTTRSRIFLLFHSRIILKSIVAKKTVRKTQDWMNTYPRKILHGLIPLEKLEMEIGEGFLIPSFLEVKQ